MPSTTGVYSATSLLTCRKIHDKLSVEGNPTLYKWLYEKTFDTAAVKRRWNKDKIPSWHFENDNDNGSDVDSDFILRETKRRKSGNGESLPISSVTSKQSPHLDLERNHSLLAEEYRDRLRIFRQFRMLNDSSNRENSTDDHEAEHVFWTIWWMVTEHGMLSSSHSKCKMALRYPYRREEYSSLTFNDGFGDV